MYGDKQKKHRVHGDKQKKHHRDKERKRYTQLHNKILQLSERVLGPSRVSKKWDKLRRIFLCCRSLKWLCCKLKGKNLSKFLPQEVKLFRSIDSKVMKSFQKQKSAKRSKAAHIVFLKKTLECSAESSSDDNLSSQLHHENQVQVHYIDSSAPDYPGNNTQVQCDTDTPNDTVNTHIGFSSGHDVTFCESSLSSSMCTASSQQMNLVTQADHESIVVPVGNNKGSAQTREAYLNSTVPKFSVPASLQCVSQSSSSSSSLSDQQLTHAKMYFNNNYLEPWYVGTGDADNSCDSTEKEEKCFMLESEWEGFNYVDMFSNCASPSPVKLGKDMEELIRRCLWEE